MSAAHGLPSPPDGVTTLDGWCCAPELMARIRPGVEIRRGAVRLRIAKVDEPWIADALRGLVDEGPPLADRPVREIASVLGSVGARFLDTTDPLRVRAETLVSELSGLSPPMTAAVIDGMASDWTATKLRALLDREFGEGAILDGFARWRGRTSMAIGGRLTVQIASGNVPGVGVTALVRSLLVKSPILLKPGAGDMALPLLFAQGLREADPRLADALAVVYWRRGDPLESAALRVAETVVAYGADEATSAVRDQTPVTARFVAHHHRVSVAVAAAPAISEDRLHRTATELARAIAFFDQRGCVSPQIVYVEGDASGARRLATGLARALGELEESLPGGRLGAEEAADLAQLRGTADLMAVVGSGVEVWHGDPATWTVVLDPSETIEAGCAGRVVRLRPFSGLDTLASAVEPLGKHLQTVGVAGLSMDRLERFARMLGRIGACRVVPFTMVPFPAPWAHHDGNGPLAELVRWVDLEEEDPDGGAPESEPP